MRTTVASVATGNENCALPSLSSAISAHGWAVGKPEERMSRCMETPLHAKFVTSEPAGNLARHEPVPFQALAS